MGDIAALNGGQPVSTDEENTGGRDFEPMPAGWYPVECKKAEIKDTKNKQGKYLWLECDVIGERYSGRKLFPRFNLVNPNAQAVEISRRDLGFLGQSVGMPTGISDSKDLLGKQFDVRVKIKPAEGNYPADNEPTAYAVLGAMSSKTPAQAPSSKPSYAAAPAQRAWDKPAEAPKDATPTPPAGQPPVKTQAAAGAAPARAPRPWEKKS